MIGLTSGCAFKGQNVVLAPVGPPLLVEASRGAREGTLAVYTALDIGTPGEPDHARYHSDYRIYSLDGRSLKYVRNRVATYSEDPVVVSLPPGRYKVVARAS